MDANKVKLIQKVLKDKEALFITSPSNIFYLTNKKLDGFFLLITKKEVFALTSIMLKSQIEDMLGLKTISASTLKKQFQQVKKIGIIKLYLDTRLVPLSLYEILKRYYKNIGFSQLLTNLRMIKSVQEIEKIKQAVYITNRVLQETKLFIKEGVIEKQVKNFILERFLLYNVEPSFEPIVAFGRNSAYPHHISDETQYKNGDIVLIDLGCKVEGYCCDITRVYNLNKETKKCYNILNVLQKKLISMCKVGTKVKDIHKFAVSFLSKYYLDKNYIHGTGHGLGLDIHEEPYLSLKDKTFLKEGMVITIEPGIYFNGRFGLRIEDDILITDSNPKVLTEDIK